MVLQARLEDAPQHEALEDRLQRPVADRTRNQQHDAVADAHTEIESQDAPEDDAAAAGLEDVQVTFDHVDQVARQSLLVGRLDAVHQHAVQLAARLDHALHLHQRRRGGNPRLRLDLSEPIAPVGYRAFTGRNGAVR